MHVELARRTDYQDSRVSRCRQLADRAQAAEGQAHDGRSAADMLDQNGDGQCLLADRAYNGEALRQSLAERGA